MKNFLHSILYSIPIISFSQNDGDTISFKQNVFNKEKKTYEIFTNKLSNSVFTYCDKDSDGFLEIDLNEIKNYVLAQNAISFGIQKGIYISTSGNNIDFVTDLDTSPQISNTCSTGFLSSLLDIAVSENNEYYIAKGNKVYKLTNTCGIDIDYSFSIPGSITSLSFDRLNNLYMGGFDSKVYRLNSGNYSQNEVWHDFGTGKAGGDFVMYNDKMYIAWNNNSNYNLFEVIVDNGNNYVSHSNLGNIPFETYGLASELGSLYGITPNALYKINLTDLSTETILSNNSLVAWYGAAGKNEAVNFITNAYESLNNAQINQNPLQTNWINTQSGGQTIYISITETLNNQNIIIPIDIVINPSPFFNNPNIITYCESNINSNTFNIRATENSILGGQTSVIVNYYENQNDANNNSNPLPDIISFTSNNKTIFVKLINTLTGCSTVFSFVIQVEKSPVLNQPENLIVCNSKSNISIPMKFNTQTDTILEGQLDGNYSVNYFNTITDAEQALNPIPNNYTLTNNFKEIFFRIDNLTTGCHLIGSFNINVLQENFNNSVSFQIENHEWTDNNNTIEILTDNQESYNYSLNGINYQSENFFENLLPGEYNVFVKNISTCEFNQKNVLVLMYPLFFTPNNDGVNDIWHIKDAEKENRIQVSIFDRYGKLIKKLNSNDVGWDGTHNNQKLPADDYWFIVNRENGKTFKGHFTLKR